MSPPREPGGAIPQDGRLDIVLVAESVIGDGVILVHAGLQETHIPTKETMFAVHDVVLLLGEVEVQVVTYTQVYHTSCTSPGHTDTRPACTPTYFPWSGIHIKAVPNNNRTSVPRRD